MDDKDTFIPYDQYRTVAADDLVTQGTRTSAATVLTLSRNVPVSAPGGIKLISYITLTS